MRTKQRSYVKIIRLKRAAVIIILILLACLIVFLVTKKKPLPETENTKPLQEIRYHDNGSIYRLLERDEKGNEVFCAYYEEDGTLDHTREYTYWENNNLSQERYTDYSTGYKSTKYYSSDGVLQRKTSESTTDLFGSESYYDDNGNIMYEVRYDVFGEIPSWKTCYDENGNTVRDIWYDDAGNQYAEELHQYSESGVLEQTCKRHTSGLIVTTYYRPDGHWYLETYVDAKTEFSFERDIDASGTVLSKRCVDASGKLLAEWNYVDNIPQDVIWYIDDQLLCLQILAACL